MTLFNEYFFKKLRFLTDEINKLHLVEEFMKATEETSKFKRRRKTKSYFKKFKRENPDIWRKIEKFYVEYNTFNVPIFFAEEEEEGLFRYNPEEIKPMDLVLLLMLSEEKINETILFRDWRTFQSVLFENGYKEMASFMEFYNIGTVYDIIEAY